MSVAPFLMMSDAPEIVKLVFRFQINGSVDPDSVLPAGIVTDIVRTGAGLFTVTLNRYNRWPVLLGATGHVVGSTVGMTVEPAGVPDTAYDSATGELLLRVVGQDGTPAATDPADNDWVYVEATFARRDILAQSAAI